MFEKEFESFSKRYHDLSERLSSPEALSNMAEYRQINREYSRISSIFEVLKAYRKVAGQLEGVNELLENERDPELREMAQIEHQELLPKEEELRQEVMLSLVPRDEAEERNCVLEIRAGTGGNEAALFAGDLFRMYSRFAERQGWTMNITDISDGEAGGFKEIIAIVEGDGAFGRLRFEGGTHRVQRVPATEANGRIHTSAVTVAVLPEAEEVELDIAEKDIRVDVYRSSGPGGQSVNTTDSCVRVTHLPTGMIVTCQDEKSQIKNRAKALRVLRSRLMQLEEEKAAASRSSERRQMIGSGDRSEKIRTYNYPQSRVTDHRIGLTKNNLQFVLDGDLDDFLDALAVEHRRAQVEKAMAEDLTRA